MSYSLNLFREIIRENKEKNVFISPLSVLCAMAIATAAANGTTELELLRVLGFKEGSYENIHKEMGKFFERLNSVEIANKIWVNQDIDIKEDFKKFVLEVYRVIASNIDVSTPEQTAKLINDWVSLSTKEKITELVKPSSINDNLLAIITNAVVFKQDWVNKFEPDLTTYRDWFTPNGNKEQRLLMKMRDSIDVQTILENGTRMVRLPFKGNVSMILIRPEDNFENMEEYMKKFHQIIEDFDENKIKSLKQTWDVPVKITMPKWTFEGEYGLVNCHKRMGIDLAFGGGTFERMTDHNVYISKIIHKTFVEVNEDGAEMAAATAVEFCLESMIVTAEPIYLTFDRPFYYLAVDDFTNAIMFAGTMLDPS